MFALLNTKESEEQAGGLERKKEIHSSIISLNMEDALKR